MLTLLYLGLAQQKVLGKHETGAWRFYFMTERLQSGVSGSHS